MTTQNFKNGHSKQASSIDLSILPNQVLAICKKIDLNNNQAFPTACPYDVEQMVNEKISISLKQMMQAIVKKMVILIDKQIDQKTKTVNESSNSQVRGKLDLINAKIDEQRVQIQQLQVKNKIQKRVTQIRLKDTVPQIDKIMDMIEDEIENVSKKYIKDQEPQNMLEEISLNFTKSFSTFNQSPSPKS